MLRFLFVITIFFKRKNDKKAEIEIKIVDKIDNNLEDKTLENNIQKKKLNNGRKITINAIFILLKNYFFNSMICRQKLLLKHLIKTLITDLKKDRI